MAFRICLRRIATRLSDLSVVRRRCVVVLWRLRQTSDVAETTCSFTEPSPDVFQVLLTCNDKPEIRRLVHGIDMLISWSEGVKACLRADGWREIDAPVGSYRTPGRLRHESNTMKIVESHLQDGSSSPKTQKR